MISVRLHFHGAIDRRGLEQDQALSCPSSTTIEGLLDRLGYPPLQRKAIIPMIASRRMPMSHVLHDGDILDVLAPAGGG